MVISTRQKLKALYVLSWMIFVGVCIEAGGFITNAVATMVLNPVGARHFWQQVDLSALYQFDHGYFLIQTSLMSIVAVMRACIFYLIVKMLHEKKLSLNQPFNRELGDGILKISYFSLVIGLLSWYGVKYSLWFVTQGVQMPDVESLRLGGADVWLFMGVTLYIVAQMFKRGIEIQSEIDLTV